MRGGQFTGLTIVENGTPKPWGIPEEDIESAWMVSSSRIEFSYDKNTDKITIYHGESEKVTVQNTEDQNSFINNSKKKIFIYIYITIIILIIYNNI